MSDAAAFKATYSDLKFVKSRKVAQIIVELPIEAAARFVEVFGAPDPSKETWVAIARLADIAEAAEQDDRREKRKWHDLRPSQQAALRCSQSEFLRFIGANDTDSAARYVRLFCGVESRKELDTNEMASDKWKHLENEYYAWQRGYDDGR